MIPFLTTTGLWIVLSFISISLIFLALKKKTDGKILNPPKNAPIKELIQGAHIAQLCLFIFISAFVLLLSVITFNKEFVPSLLKNTAFANVASAFAESGLASAINMVFAGLSIIIIFHIFDKGINLIIRIIAKITKWEVTTIPPFKLDTSERSLIWLIILSIYTIVFFVGKDYNNSFSFFSFIAAYFLWIGIELTETKTKATEILGVSWAYWLVILFILILIPVTTIYKSDYIQMAAAVIGELLGITLHVLVSFILCRKWIKIK